MASYQEFVKNDVTLRYFKDANVILMLPQGDVEKDKVILLKRQLETYLSVDDVKVEQGGISLKLSDSSTNVPEFLRALGAKGGEGIEDAASVAAKPAEQEVKDKEKETGQPAPSEDQPQPGQEEQLNASLQYETIDILFETFLKPRRQGKRTGKYWVPLEKVSGKNRMKIQPQDVLNMRRKYARKPPAPRRNLVLRSLDKSVTYFERKIEEVEGSLASDSYVNEYYAIDNLTPSDYSEDAGKPEALQTHDDAITAHQDEDQINGPKFSDFLDLLDKRDDEEDESYEDIEVDKETRI